MLTPPLRPDYRDPRRWDRVWRDRPGFFPGKAGCFCCPSTACTPTSATVGTVGTESGSECSDCSTSRILDNFSSFDAAWTSGGTGCASVIGPTGWHVSGGVLVSGSNNIIRPFTRPALSGFCVQIKVKLVSYASSGTVGLVLAYGRSWFARQFFSNYGVQSKIDAQSCVVVGSTFSTFGPAPAANDIISMIIRDAGNMATDGLVTICYQINGTTVRVEENVQVCFADPMWAGLQSGNNGATFDDFQVLTS